MQIRSVRNPIYARIELAMKELQGVQGKVGWYKKIKHPDSNLTVAHIAAIQELGYAKKQIPPRPFIMPTVHENQYSWKEIAYHGSKEIIKGNATAASVMGLIGEKASGQIKQKIASIYTPPLRPSTIKRRQLRYKDTKTVGNLYKPLVDTGYMVNSLSYTVETV